MAQEVAQQGVQSAAQSSSSRVFVPVPKFEMDGQGVSTRPVTAAEAATLTMANRAKLAADMISWRSGHYAVDSLRAVVAANAMHWFTELQHQPVRGIQLDPLGYVGVMASQEPFAKAQITARLATPGLSLLDKAYTLRMAVDAFGGDPHMPERLPMAETYLEALDAMGDTVAAWQYDARKTLLTTYYLLGRSPDVMRHGTHAIALLPRIAYADRDFLGLGDVYGPTIDALTAQPNARPAIEQLNATLRAIASPAPALIASDSAYYWMGQGEPAQIENLIAGNARLGTSGAPLIAHYWLNRASHDSATVPVDDGKIRIVEMAHTGCPGCVYALYGLQRLHVQFPQIEPIMVTYTFGSWANRLVDPAEEIAYLTDFFVTSTKVTFPVGIWAGKKVPNEDGGLSPTPSANEVNYPTFGKPMLWVLDGHGQIRRIFTGYGLEIQAQLQHTVEFLLREAAATSSSMASSSAVSQ